jgi:hypothetical protein
MIISQDMEEVKQQMQKLKKENQRIEKELRGTVFQFPYIYAIQFVFFSTENATVDQKARLLETRVVENAETIEQLRQERSMIVAEHKELQRRFTDATEVFSLNSNQSRGTDIVHRSPMNFVTDVHLFQLLMTTGATNSTCTGLKSTTSAKH